MKRDDVFPSRFLKAGDLNGKPLTVTIASAKYETLKNPKGGDEQKLVLGFLKLKKVLITNITNFDAIEHATGKGDSDDWPGHKIQIYPTEVLVGSEMKPCIRVRAPDQGELKPSATRRPIKKPTSDDMDDAIPFD